MQPKAYRTTLRRISSIIPTLGLVDYIGPLYGKDLYPEWYPEEDEYWESIDLEDTANQ